PDPRGRHAQKFRRGAGVVFSLSNAAVDGGSKTAKVQKGVLVRRRRSSDLGGGTVTALEGADLGWHLVHNDAPLWLGLQGLSFREVLDCVLDPSWGFGLPSRTENDTKRRLNPGRAGAQLAASPRPVLP